MDDESRYVPSMSEKKQKTIMLSLVVVLLAMGVAVSGWIIVSALEKMSDADPFCVEREYDVAGIYLVDGSEKDCTGYATTKFSSETEAFSVMTYHVSYGSESDQRSISFSIMFDGDRVPVSSFKYLGEEGGYSLWEGDDRGVHSVYSLDDKSVVHHVLASYQGDELSLTEKGQS